ncbi:MAG: phosphoribosylamine--glycine ligase [Verrucomicrobia bacterium]|nr:phosphoribosylamine--glycine ligase [Verrucomicrobiota bacterium]
MTSTKRILIVGSGGREHALCWKLAHDSSRPELFIAPGNAGTAQLGMNLAIGAEDLDALEAWAVEHRPELTVIGPEAPLCGGLADRLQAHGLLVFGPGQAAARLEGSKHFAKEVMIAAGVPTAASATFSALEPALTYVRSQPPPLVVKADGLAAGKGVVICQSTPEAEAAVFDMLDQGTFGEAGRQVVIEEFLVGEEASILALVDGSRSVLLDSSQDHKRVGEGDTGLNTGGMGAYSPAPVVTADLWPIIQKDIIDATVSELRRRGIDFRGVLYAGLMIHDGKPKVLEFNCRFGDPECQAILIRWEGDLLPALEACAQGDLRPDLVRWKPQPSVCVVMTAPGYPGEYPKGAVIRGLEEAGQLPDTEVFHAGTGYDGDDIVTSGGRVLGITARGETLKQALTTAYTAVDLVQFDGAYVRRDIGWRAIGT